MTMRVTLADLTAVFGVDGIEVFESAGHDSVIVDHHTVVISFGRLDGGTRAPHAALRRHFPAAYERTDRGQSAVPPETRLTRTQPPRAI